MAHIQPLGATEADPEIALAATEAAPENALGATGVAPENALAATEVDRRLRNALRELQLAERNAILWFAEVSRRKLFKDLGFSSIYQYASEALGFSRPRTAQFIRLCESLEGLPALKDSVAAGDVSWTKAREVAKVATPQTESAWVDLARVESRRKLERRVRLAQTHSRAKRRHGGRQLGLADAAAASESDSRGVQSAAPNVHCAEVPVTLSLRFTPEQYARYEAILEQLRKHGERGPREELILAGMEALLVEAGSGAADPVSGRNAKGSPVRGVKSVSPREARSLVRGAKSVSPREARSLVRGVKSVSPREVKSSARGAAAVPARIAKSSAAPKTTPASPAERASDPSADPGKVSPRNFKPVYQIVVQQCEDCGRARVQTSRGAKVIDPAAAEAMRCDARILRPRDENHPGEERRPGDENRPGNGNHPGEERRPGDENRPGNGNHPGEERRPGDENRPGNGNHPGDEDRSGGKKRSGGNGLSNDESLPGTTIRSGPRNRATIPPSVRRKVMARDGYRCRAPGCGSARFLEVHHVVSRAEGGSNRPDNLVTLCSACHRLTHSHPHQSVSSALARSTSPSKGASSSDEGTS